jgi:phosphohistidine swiveling domain-containing protein
MKRVNNKTYDFIWTVGGMHYLFTSIWLQEEYLKRDFIVTSDHDFYTLYLAKSEREKLSVAGLKLYYKDISAYKRMVEKQLKTSENFFIDLQKKKFVTFSNAELADHFSGTVKYFQKIWMQYFWTEYFCLDRIAGIINNSDKRFDLDLLKRNVDKMARLKLEQRKYLNKTFYQEGPMNEYYKLISDRLKLSKITQYHYREVIELLKGSVIEIPDRSVYVKGKFSKWQDILGRQAQRIIKDLEVFDDKVNIIKGQTGNKGSWRGRVKIIKFDLDTDFIKEVKEMKKGQVLVSGSTGPEMILACKKAGAIITDEGGITSHAALISRELGIPSVIATKYATRILKDGDLVEVDANNGIVRKL